MIRPEKSPLRQVDDGRKIEGRSISTVYSSNEDAFEAILFIYGRPRMVIADVTYGKGVFWKKVDRTAYRLKTSDLEPGRAETVADFRSLPYEDDSIDLLVFDPPYRYTPAASRPQEYLDERYKLSANSIDISRVQKVADLYEEGMREAYRVLKLGGFLIVKCQDTIQDGRQYRMRIELHNRAISMGFADRDEVVVVGTARPSRWPIQIFLAKSHSYFLIFRKGGVYPFGYRPLQKR